MGDVKTYRGEDAKQLLRTIRAELGESAMIHSSKMVAPRRGRRVREIEITASTHYTPDYIPEVSQFDLFAGERRAPSPEQSRDEIWRTADRLLRLRGMGAELRGDLLAAYRRRAVEGAGLDLGLLAELLAERLKFAPLGESRSELRSELRPELRGVFAFVGRPGAGKSTNLQKLALAQGAGIVTTDCHRLGAGREMRCFAEMSGLAFAEAATPDELADAIVSLSHCSLILIDTAGVSRRDAARRAELEALLNVDRRIQRVLVLAADAGAPDLADGLAEFAALGARRVLLSKCDETSQLGAAAGVLAAAGAELSWISAGQNIPEDLAQACASDFLDLLLGLDT